ncbi:MAG TPA: zf-HC2 domain-containing protein [Burkholderiales bacterium]|nr:zf-HC2 domain-containing protein [Burkholderiales bacterium]HYA46154.1 zf-HC2 domain-containing protein [Burkholderiales bacterium]
MFRLSCKEASRLISEGMDRRLSLSEKIGLRLHVGICDACTRFTSHVQFLRRALKAFPGPDEREER